MNMKLSQSSREVLMVSLGIGGMLLVAMLCFGGAGKCMDIFLLGILFSVVAAFYTATHAEENVLSRVGIASTGVIFPFMFAALMSQFWCMCI